MDFVSKILIQITDLNVSNHMIQIIKTLDSNHGRIFSWFMDLNSKYSFSWLDSCLFLLTRIKWVFSIIFVLYLQHIHKSFFQIPLIKLYYIEYTTHIFKIIFVLSMQLKSRFIFNLLHFPLLFRLNFQPRVWDVCEDVCFVIKTLWIFLKISGSTSLCGCGWDQ